MFPIPFNFPFRKKDGSMTTIGDEISGGGGGGYTLPTASAETKGGVKIGSGLSMSGEVLNNSNPTPYSLPTASAETKGGVKVGSGLSMDGEVLNNSNPTPYSLPTASAETKGGIKVGSGLSIDENGVLSASGGGGALHTITRNISITSSGWGTPPYNADSINFTDLPSTSKIIAVTYVQEDTGSSPIKNALVFYLNKGSASWNIIGDTTTSQGINTSGKLYITYTE